MADSQSKVEAAAEKAFAEAAEKKTAGSRAGKVAVPAANPVAAPAAKAIAAAPVKPPLAAPLTTPTPAPVAAKPAKPVVAKVAKPAPVKAPKAPKAAVAQPGIAAPAPAFAAPAAPVVAATPAPAAVPSPEPVAVAAPAPVAPPVAEPAAPALVEKIVADNEAAVAAAKPNPFAHLPFAQFKETIMNTEYTLKAQEVAAEYQSRAKAAFDAVSTKSAEYSAEATEFAKGNLEAVVASGKILAAGLQDMGRSYVAEAKGVAETVTSDVKAMAAIKSPAELFQLQGEIARRNFDAAVKTASKSTEAMIKLANEAFAPLSTRFSLAAEKFSKAA